MFVSDSKAEIKGLEAILEPGQRAWHLMLKPQLSPWFHVTAVRWVDVFDTRDILFIDSLQALIAWMGNCEDGIEIESIQLVSPAWMNGKQCWEMDILTEIVQAQDDNSVRFTLLDGRKLYYPEPRGVGDVAYSTVIYRLNSKS